MDNPDQRIAVDVRGFTDTALTFSLTMFNALIDLISFSGGALRCAARACSFDTLSPPIARLLFPRLVGTTRPTWPPSWEAR